MNMQNLLKQAQKMQKELTKMEDTLKMLYLRKDSYTLSKHASNHFLDTCTSRRTHILETVLIAKLLRHDWQYRTSLLEIQTDN